MQNIKPKSRRFIYRTTVSWIKDKKGILCSSGKPNIEVATPPEFKGHEGVWAPEELFVASINICIMTTFLYYMEKENLEIKGYQSSAEGILEMGDKGFSFTKIEVSPTILVADDVGIEKAKKSLGLAEGKCLISNSTKSEVVVKPNIRKEV